MATKAEAEALLKQAAAEFYDDPLGFVLFAYPWGEGELKGRTPKRWQTDFLVELGQLVRERGFDGKTPVMPIQFSTASGHGIGKSALVAWIIDWIQCTRPHSKGTVTANTGDQLKTKTWGELATWHNRSIFKHWFTLTSGSGSLSRYHKAYRETWRVDGQTCREENSEAFAGQHAAHSTSFYIFDEASAVPDKIWEVREGGLTDGEPMTFDFGNPTRNTGQFYYNMMGKSKERYRRRFINSEDVEHTGNTELFDQWAEEWGRDSDFYKVRVLGQFPSASALQFIPMGVVDNCIGLDVWVGPNDPVVMGIDVARFGDDRSVIWIRHGRDATTPGPFVYKGVDTMHVVGEASRLAAKHKPDAIFVDSGGVGAGVYDRLNQLGYPVFGVESGEKNPVERGQYANNRAAMWDRMRQELKEGTRLPDDMDMKADLTGLEYGYNARNEIQLERKEDMKKRGLASPDLADALALTYFMPVAAARQGYKGGDNTTTHEYDPYDDL